MDKHYWVILLSTTQQPVGCAELSEAHLSEAMRFVLLTTSYDLPEALKANVARMERSVIRGLWVTNTTPWIPLRFIQATTASTQDSA